MQVPRCRKGHASDATMQVRPPNQVLPERGSESGHLTSSTKPVHTIRRCRAAAKVMQAMMMEEDGIQGAVDHLHRTIYGALLAGRTFKWMKRVGDPLDS